jgi:hypothetical protein
LRIAKYVYFVYKKPIQLETLHIVQYLHFHGVCLQQYLNANIRTELPTIRCNGQQFSGLTEVVGFFERMSNVQDLLAKATEWKKRI